MGRTKGFKSGDEYVLCVFDQRFGFLFFLSLITPPGCFSHCGYSFMQKNIFHLAKKYLLSVCCVPDTVLSSKEYMPCPRGMYSTHIQRYFCGDKSSPVQVEFNQYWKRPIQGDFAFFLGGGEGPNHSGPLCCTL